VTLGGELGPVIPVSAPEALPAAWFDGTAALAAGLISTSFDPSGFSATWDFVRVLPDDAVVYRVNAGGPTLTAADGLGDWTDDSVFAQTGKSFATTDSVGVDSTVPTATPTALFQTERFDPPALPELQYVFPVVAGLDYELRLFFAEIYDGIDGAGQRVFDVFVDGILVLDDFDPYATAGPDVGTMRAVTVTATDDRLTVGLVREVENPKIAAIEIRRLVDPPTPGNQPPILSNPGDQTSPLNAAIAPLALVAADPDAGDTLQFTGAASLPPGMTLVQTGPTVAEVRGTPTTLGGFSVTLGVSDGIHPPTEVHFDWTVTGAPASSSITAFVLVNAASNVDRRPLTEGDEIVLANDTPFNLRAEAAGAVGSVVFELNGVAVRTENAAPYALAGDTRGNYAAAALDAGAYTLTARPFEAKGGSGQAGDPLTIQFAVAETDEERRPEIRPLRSILRATRSLRWTWRSRRSCSPRRIRTRRIR